MSQFTLEVLADQCGVSMPNLRSWQRYGLLQPVKEKNGRRYYAHSHLMRIELIVSWLNQGVALPEVASLLKGEQATFLPHWQNHRQKILTALEQQQPDKVRALLRLHGRELPARALVDHIITPLRMQLKAPPARDRPTLSVFLDTLILEYITFVLQSLRKRPAPTLTVIPLTANDPMDIWLAALMYAAEGMHIDVLAFPIADPDLSVFACDHFLLWSDCRPSAALNQQLILWQQQGKHLMTAGPGFHPLATSQPDG